MMTSESDSFDYQRYAILFVDDEANTRKYFKRLFGEKFRILEAVDGADGLAVFQRHANEIGIIMTDQRMPNETGVGFLSKTADQYPDIIKILSTAYSDIDAAIGSVNQGGIFRYMTKPWDIPQLEVTLRRAMEFYTVKRERDALLNAKMQDTGGILLATRLATFALVPVCAAIPCVRVAEAVSSFVQAGVAGRRVDTNISSALRSSSWTGTHARQVILANGIESQLPVALSIPDLAGRAAALIKSLKNAGAVDAAGVQNGSTLQIPSKLDPMPALLNALLGRTSEEVVTQAAVQVLCAFMAVYDAHGVIRRLAGEDFVLEIAVSAEEVGQSTAGMETARWLIDDQLLISAAAEIR